jgi:biotin-(acetyl-CoA carboxylase) ligase
MPHLEWQRKLVGMGQPVSVTVLDSHRQVTGTMAGVDENGALRIRRPDGSIVSVIAGDVTLR